MSFLFRHCRISKLNVFNHFHFAFNQNLKVFQKLMSFLLWHFIVIFKFQKVLIKIKDNCVLEKVVIEVHLVQRNYKILFPNCSTNSNYVWKWTFNNIEKIVCNKTDVNERPFYWLEKGQKRLYQNSQFSIVLRDHYNFLFK